MAVSEFISGTLEGFYGKPWSIKNRIRLFEWMKGWGGMNAYMYAPKDDLFHRSQWRENYSSSHLQALSELLKASWKNDLRFIYALAPGLDIIYSDENEWQKLINKIEQIWSLGCRDFALLFDDIPSKLSTEDQNHFDSFAQAQGMITNRLYHYLIEKDIRATLQFCPTIYCGHMADYDVSNNAYLNELGDSLDSDIGFFWTGPEVVSPEISVESIQELRAVIKRKPLIWENLHANDYDMKQIFFGPFSGRELALKNEIAGILSNPNNEFWANFIPLKTLSDYIQCTDTWAPRSAYYSAVKAWKKEIGNTLLTEGDIMTLADHFYLPGSFGDEANSWLSPIEKEMNNGNSPSRELIYSIKALEMRVKEAYEKILGGTNRPLVYDIYPYILELRTDLALLSQWLEWRSTKSGNFKSKEIVPRRQGVLHAIQKLVNRN